MGFRVWGLGFRAQGLGFRVWGLGFRAIFLTASTVGVRECVPRFCGLLSATENGMYGLACAVLDVQTC